MKKFAAVMLTIMMTASLAACAGNNEAAETSAQAAGVESYDFSGKTIIPFCTSASSGISSSALDLEALTSGATGLEGNRFSGSDLEAAVMDWAKGLSY